ncbi:hypothetical protein [Nocardia carnea]|uniref:hypothetical protein n=1 Tax=Nocardia carnea TaxID=37328 RepID=UPI0024563A03|nr:hypothetical protein [Nocardia carnea]
MRRSVSCAGDSRDGVVGFDLSIPCQVFSLTPGYEVRVCAARRVAATAAGQQVFRISSQYNLDDAEGADTVIVPGVDLDRPLPPWVSSIDLRGSARLTSTTAGSFTTGGGGVSVADEQGQQVFGSTLLICR